MLQHLAQTFVPVTGCTLSCSDRR